MMKSERSGDYSGKGSAAGPPNSSPMRHHLGSIIHTFRAISYELQSLFFGAHETPSFHIVLQ